MGKRSAVVELFLGDMGSIQRELRPSILREDQLTMETKLEQIAVKARGGQISASPRLPLPSRATGCLRIYPRFPNHPPPGATVRPWRPRKKGSDAGVKPR